ncbi:MAG: regulatory iron-sulfur-containing complex subunit RicT, partial [Bacteroidota bacterium]
INYYSFLVEVIAMSCQGCAVGDNGKPNGCKSNGGCSSGGCNRLNTYDWLSKMDIYDPSAFQFVEVSFKNGSRKEFFRNEPHTRTITGDSVVVEAQNGYDIGEISLSGELVRLQMKKKRKDVKGIKHSIIRRANERDMERLQEAREAEQETMVRARVIARSLDLDMKIGDVEFQGDKRKATFYYVADGRVDFRELIRHFAKEFKIKIEMRQIGARQESARIGGIGSCGRELCCSTWLTDFKSVSTTAARYQNLAINQSKLSGQCGRLKCCLNYELDTYMDALQAFPKGLDALQTQAGKAVLVKTDIFKRIMYFAYEKEGFRGQFYPLDVERVKEIAKMNKTGEKPLDLQTLRIIEEVSLEEEMDFDADLTGVIELPMEKRKKKRRKSRSSKDNKTGNRSSGNRASDSESKGKPSYQKGRGQAKGKVTTINAKSDRKPKSNNRGNKTNKSKDTKVNSNGGANKGRNTGQSKIATAKTGEKPANTREERRAQREANGAKPNTNNRNRKKGNIEQQSKQVEPPKANQNQVKAAVVKETKANAKPQQVKGEGQDQKEGGNTKPRRSNRNKNRRRGGNNNAGKTAEKPNNNTSNKANIKPSDQKPKVIKDNNPSPKHKSADNAGKTKEGKPSNSRRNRNQHRNRQTTKDGGDQKKDNT